MNFDDEQYQPTRGRHAAWAYGQLRDRIVKGHLAPGAALSENRLAEELGVSRTPVREALIKLAEDNLVRIVPQSGTFVSLVDLAAVLDSQLIREALECSTVFLAARNATPEAVNDLRGIVERQRACMEAGDHPGLIAADDALHDRLIEISGRPGVLRAVHAAKLHLDRIRYLTIEETPHIAEIIAQHQSIVDHVAGHDGRAARRAMREHQRMLLAKIDQFTWSHNVLVGGAVRVARAASG